jgi:lipopolysaccharide/colanic/teichoic acid biosynthesis glycosyltransferase
MRLDVDVAGVPSASAPAAPETRRLSHLYSPEQIAFVLQRERLRADRHRGEFSLVMFRSEADMRLDDALLEIAKIILEHARTTDEIGHYDKTSVCVVLPETGGQGAWNFAQRVCDSAKRDGLMPVCVVYTYPSAWFPKPKHHSDNHNGDGNRGVLPMSLDDNGNKLVPSEIPVQPLQALLARRMPWWKRALDVIGASLALLTFSPVMAIIAIAIKLTSPGPVIFKQKRAGLGGRPFEIYKFRSMTTDAEARKKELMALNEQDGPAFKIKFDPRITRIGKFIRITSLDELPQLWNVIRGEMSLVGPRPLPIDEAGAADQWQQRRLDVTPGLTCIWQIKGRSRVTFDEWCRMDISYIRRRNIAHDLSILFQTIPAVLLRRGAR